MGCYRFGGVQVLFADSSSDQDELFMGALVQAGFGRISRATDFDRLVKRLSGATPDLLILHANAEDGDPFGLCRDLRHNLIGENPFTTVLEWATRPTEDIVRRALGSGVDDLLTRAPTAAEILQRMARLVQHRKPFVVTSDYVGPDRRDAGSRDDEMPLIQVPNALRAKATGDVRALADLEAEIAATIALVDLQKVERHVERIAYLVALIEWVCQDVTGGEGIEAHLAALTSVADDLARRAAQSEVRRLCSALSAAAGRMRGLRIGPQSPELERLRTLTRDITVACKPLLDGTPDCLLAV